MSQFSFVLFGNQSILAQCAGKILDAGHRIVAVVTSSDELARWADTKEITHLSPTADLTGELSTLDIDWILSLAYLSVIPDDILSLAHKGAVNFHDGILPNYAGLNTPVWARINEEPEHGITWHFMEGGVDEGDILEQHRFPISQDDTAFTLNTKCFETAVESFDGILEKLTSGMPPREKQTLENRGYFARIDRPNAFGLIDFSATTSAIAALVHGLDHQNYWNPLTTPKVVLNNLALNVGTVEAGQKTGPMGEVLETWTDGLEVATADGSVRLGSIMGTDGKPASTNVDAMISVGTVLTAEFEPLRELSKNTAKVDAFWRKALAATKGQKWSLCEGDKASAESQRVSLAIDKTAETKDLLTAVAIAACRQQEGSTATIAVPATENDGSTIRGLTSAWKPLIVNGTGTLSDFADVAYEAYEATMAKTVFAADLLARAPELRGIATPDIGFSPAGAFIAGTAVTVDAKSMELEFDPSRVSSAAIEILKNRITYILGMLSPSAPEEMLPSLSVMPSEELDLVLNGWNDTETGYDESKLLHQSFEDIALKHPKKTALIFEDQKFTYAELNKKSDAVARRLNAVGIGRGDLVGLFIQRSPEMVAAAFGILKAGAAYLSLDPSYPSDRTKYCIEDSEAKAILSHSAVVSKLPSSPELVLVVDRPEQDPTGASTDNCKAAPDDLAYMIYTSGSTGKPKGVMVEHRNVANFFAGMDERIPHETSGSWLAVTSLSFDISVLEIFWTLGRGFKLVLTGDEGRTVLSNGPLPSQVQGMDFSLYYWGNDDGSGRDKYKSLLEGAKYADQHGFCGVWTPERHFHAFGGPYPNPSVTGAAVAAVTRNLSVRAGSCVAPLHHTARIAEEWSVIDNLTNGRAGLAIASGWQPDDFVLRPENSPPNNRDAMFDSIEELRKLWKGTPVAFPKADGTMHEVVTQPRPVSSEIPIWVTTAGNPETWRQAGEIGANVLTHLLGQSVAEVGDKIKIYHQALRENGHDPADFDVTLMLHTYLAEDRDTAREIAREPMKDYLRSAAGLIKQYAWAFPAFKRPEGVDNAFQLDLGVLNEEELEAILDFAFLRYFDDSGLFGTVADAMKRVEEVKKIGVTEIACLIDYGIGADTVLDGLRPVAEVVRRCNEGAKLDDGDFSVAAQILRHKVTHMQCTPSMARMFMMNDETRRSMGEMDHILIGGEALPGALVKDINAVSNASIQNMYGPTETTIWSTTAEAKPVDGTVSIGAPISNTSVYVLDEDHQPVPVGVPGELWIGGAGVARGYWKRPDLTNERFIKDPFSDDPNARIYATGDLVNWSAEGQLNYIGRTDFQVKVRGFRIELGEIEAAMDSRAEVKQSAVVVHQESEADTRLLGYFTATETLSESQFRSYLSERLPAHMVPSSLIQIDDMPLTPNKKIDRKALIELGGKSPDQPIQSAQPEDTVTGDSGSIETSIASIWSSILGVRNLSGSDNFFDVGGHSLLAVQAHREIRENLSVPKLSITDIFRFPILRDLSNRVSELNGTKQATQEAAAPQISEKAESKSDLRSSAIERRRAMRARRKA